MMITAELASLHGLAIERRQVSQDDSPQPVVASATLRSRRPALVPDGKKHIAQNDERQDDAPAETVEPRHDRRQGDLEYSSGEQRNDRRKQAQPTLIDTRSRRGRRQTDGEVIVDFEI